MPPRLSELVAKGIANPPSGMDQMIQLEVYIGSSAYAINSDSSDLDVLGFWIPPLDSIFPNLRGLIPGFDSGFEEDNLKFRTYTEHHMMDNSALGGTGREYDYSIHSIVKFCKLLLKANPTLIESLFVPERCILHMTPIGEHMRENRKLFLCRALAENSAKYARGQLHKLHTKDPTDSSKRRDLIDKYGYDVKFATHVVRILDQAYQILTKMDIDIESNSEKLKAIKRGDWELAQVQEHFKIMEPLLLQASEKCPLPWDIDRDRVRELLVYCLKKHFGPSLEKVVVSQDKPVQTLAAIRRLLDEGGF